MRVDLELRSPWSNEIEDLRSRGLYRTMPEMRGLPGRIGVANGREILNFSSNNYLGLAGHPRVIQALAESAVRYGVGSTASRLIAGNSEAHRELEAFLARWKGTEAAIVFGSGYQANVGVLSSVAGELDLVISDELNHASIIDGCRLSRAQVKVYPHLDLDRVDSLLRLSGFRRKLVVSESVFSMDGDRAPLKELDELCRRRGAMLMVDEAHATGIFGSQGRGWAEEVGAFPDIQMGTLGKAVGTCGAYVAGSRALIELLINRARSLIYTTALSPAIMGAALAALEIIASEEGDRRRDRLFRNMKLFRQLLPPELTPGSQASHIVPVRIGESSAAMAVSAECLAQGVFAHGIRYPTVPEGTARLRFTLMSDHTTEDLVTATKVLAAAVAKVEAQYAEEPRRARGI